MTEVITARMIIPVAIPTILLLIDGLSIRLVSWKIKLCAGSRADVSAVWSAINTRGELGPVRCRIYQLAISHQRCRADRGSGRPLTHSSAVECAVTLI